jgi:hypothetical protein
MGLIPSGLKREIRDKYKVIRSEVKKPVTIYTAPQKEGCPNCIQDHLGASVGIFNSNFVTPVEIFGETIAPQAFSRVSCPVCLGTGHLEYEASTVIHAFIRWNPLDEMTDGEMEQTPGGLEGRNVCRIKADKRYYDIIRDSKYASIDNVKCELHLPPVIRHIGEVDVVAIAFYVAVEVGHSVRDS